MKRAFFRAFIGIMLLTVTGGLAFAQTSAAPVLTGYYVAINGQQTGPYDAAGLKQLIDWGQLTRDSLVWKAGIANWTPAGTVAELAPLLASIPPPLPPPLPAKQQTPTMPANQQPLTVQDQSQQESEQTTDREYRWYNSFATGLQTNRVFINTGAGIGFFGGYDIGIPPVSLSVDIKISNVVPITIGATGIFSTWESSAGSPPYNVDVTYMNIGVGGRAMYHFNFVRNLDTYFGLMFGYVIQMASITYGRGYTSGNRPAYGGQSFFLYGGNIGIRFFFAKNFGVYFEGGYSGLQFASGGLTFKF